MTAPAPPPPRRADLVLEGGGVKGVALVGAVTALAGAGYAFPRVAGSSAGAVVGCLVAALQKAGEPVARLAELEAGLDYRRLRGTPLPGPLAPVGATLSFLLTSGLYDAGYLLDFLRSTLADLGVRTFADLRQGAGMPDDPQSALPAPERYALVVTTSDLSGRQLLRLPWDYAELGLDPDSQPVAEAVAASAAIPFFFRPVRLAGRTLVDGGLLSNFPVALFDRADGVRPRWPTYGVKLSARPGERPGTIAATGNPVTYTLAVVETLLAAQDASYVDQPCVQRRTVFVDTGDTSAVDFDLDAVRRGSLRERGAAAAERFLAGWDEAAYLRECRGFA